MAEPCYAPCIAGVKLYSTCKRQLRRTLPSAEEVPTLFALACYPSLIGALVITGLMSEALALIDLLVLVRARFFAGFWFSSFSWVVQVSPLGMVEGKVWS